MMGLQRRHGIYVDFDSSSIIRYLKPLMDNVFIARFANYYFNESISPSSWGEKSIPNASIMSHLDPRMNQCELKVQRIIHL